MKCFINSYNFSAFGDFKYIDSLPESIYSLMDLFRDDKLLPSTFEEMEGIINFSNMQHNIQQNVATRPTLNSTDKKTSIVLGSDRLNFIVNNSTQYNNLSFVTSQNKKSEEFAKKIFNHYSVISNRLAINTEIVIDDLLDDRKKFIYDNLFIPIPFYKEESSRDWSQRLATRRLFKLNNLDEELNIIFIIRHHFLETIINGKPILKKVIYLNLDINTVQENQTKRFDLNYIEPFLKEAWNIQNELLNQLEGVIVEK